MNVLLLSTISLLTAIAPAELPLQADSATIHFHQSFSNIDPDFKNNSGQLESLTSPLTAIEDSSTLKIGSVSVIGAASPEGSILFNNQLSHDRAVSIIEYTRRFVSLPDSAITEKFTGRDWLGLKELVIKDVNVPYREETLSLIDEIIVSETPDNDNIQKIKKLRNGVPYAYMYRSLFPQLRYSKIFLTYRLPQIGIQIDRGEIPVTPSLSSVPEIFLISNNTIVSPSKRPFYMALKTNMLYDALALPSLSAEFYLGKDISIVGNWTYGWWDKDSSHRYWRAYGGDIALRWWFGKVAHNKPLTGHHLGIYGGIMTYDFEFGGKGYMGGKPGGTLWDKCNVIGGVEYGYSLPIARRLNIDFTIGIGYIGGQYYEYIPKNGCYVWQSTHNLRWFGPTKAEVSLTWLIGRGNFNATKGGK